MDRNGSGRTVTGHVIKRCDREYICLPYGETLSAQRMQEQYSCPDLSIDHLKMGLIRSGNTDLTPEDDGVLTEFTEVTKQHDFQRHPKDP